VLSNATLRRDALIAAFAVLFTACVVGFGVWVSGWPRFGESDYTVKALLPSSSTLAPNARVTMAGAQVGRITAVSLHGAAALVTLKLTDTAVTPIPADSKVELRERTPVGENYISISAGRSPRRLRSGALIPSVQTIPFVDVDQILSVLKGKTQQRARELFRSAGDALHGQGQQLNTLLGGAATTLDRGARLVSVADRDRSQVARLVASLGGVADAIGARDQSIARFAHAGVATFDAVGSRDAALREFLAELPATLRQVRTTTGTVGSVSDRAAPVLARLAHAVTALRPAVQDLAPASDVAHTSLHELSAAAPKLQHTLDAVRALSKPLTTVLPGVQKLFCQVNPMLRYAMPYVPDVTSMVTNMEDATQGYDANGHIARVTLNVNEGSVGALPASAEKAANGLIRSGILRAFDGYAFSPYPKPGRQKTDSAKNNPQYSGREEFDAKSGYQYPHITADC
jgi:phospholipid/cholesterol/gamma-HCH transport system substrate-binding protein